MTFWHLSAFKVMLKRPADCQENGRTRAAHRQFFECFIPNRFTFMRRAKSLTCAYYYNTTAVAVGASQRSRAFLFALPSSPRIRRCVFS